MIYTKNIRNSRIVQLLVTAMIILVISVIGSKSYDLYKVNTIHQITKKIYDHPLRVSSLSLKMESLLYKIHRNMKDIVLNPSKEELEELILKVDHLEKKVYNSLDDIKEYILGEEGKRLENQTRRSFASWKEIRNNVILLVKKGKNDTAINITKNRGAKHVLILEKHINKLTHYAQKKATLFKNKSLETFTEFEHFSFYITGIFLCVFLFMSYYVIRKISVYIKILEKSKNLLETVIEESPNPIMLHNEEGKVLMINKVWEDLTGYKYSEIDTIEKWAEIAYGVKVNDVKEDIENLYSIKRRIEEGEYDVKRKDGQTIIWTFTSAPLGLINGKRTIISSAMDVTDLKNKDNLLYLQSKHAAMGEMIANISHQWRQPLSLISTIATGLKLKAEYLEVNKEEFIPSMEKINSTVQYLSQTINDFRNFFNQHKDVSAFNIKDVFEKTFSLVSSQFQNNNIEIIKEIEDIEITGYENELLQVIINVLNNARDALLVSEINKKYIFVNIYKNNKELVICIKDNAGGIKKNILDKVFDPYFTTKHQSQGTGIGLYMTEEIVRKHMYGTIEVCNESFNYEGLECYGAVFTITLPISIE